MQSAIDNSADQFDYEDGEATGNEWNTQSPETHQYV